MNISSIRENIENIVNFPIVDVALEEVLIDEAINQQYVITSNSPLVLKENYAIAQNSILINSSSFDDLAFYHFTIEEQEGLLRLLDYTDYTISATTPSLMKSNKSIVFISIRHDINSFQYASLDLLKDKEIFSYLIKQNYSFSFNTLRYLPLSYLLDETISTFYLKNYLKEQINVNDFNIIKTIFNHLLHHPVKMKNFESIFRVFIEQEWNNIKIEQQNRYKNVLGKLCSELSQNKSIESILSCSSYIGEMRKTLKDTYPMLEQEMRNYYHYFKSHDEEQLSQSRDKISKFTNKYLAIVKEGYIKEKLEMYRLWIKPYFMLKKNGIVMNKVNEKLRREQLKKMYDAKDKRVMDFINHLIKNTTNFIEKDTLRVMIEEFIYSKTPSITPPIRYQEYLTYLKVEKLIHRLNQNYISYDSIEMEKYRQFIFYDFTKNCYTYHGKPYTKIEQDSLIKYQKIDTINKKIRKEIMNFIKDWKIDSIKQEELISSLEESIPFNDQNYEFNLSMFFNYFTFQDLIDIGFFSMMKLDGSNKENKSRLLDEILVDRGIVLFLMMSKNTSLDFATMLEEHEFSHEKVVDIMNHLEYIASLAEKMNLDPADFKTLYRFYHLAKVATSQDLYILGDDVLEKLCTKLEFTTQNTKQIVKQALDLACLMRFKSKSTLPYIKGTYKNYAYQTYDALDIDLLISGINTNSCFKIDGNDHDFLSYCALNKNGFVLKFTINGIFVARVAGFRNGNAIYFNQLKTIYDYDGLGYTNNNQLEKENLISSMYHVSREIIQKSHQNVLEKDKIDYCFITKSFIFQDVKSNVNEELKAKITDYPMDHESKDWFQFVKMTPNLKEAKEENHFTTDYDVYPLICLASFNQHLPCVEEIKKKDVEAVYVRPKRAIELYHGTNKTLLFQLNQLKAIFSYLTKTLFEEVNLPSDCNIVLGDNWYIAYTNQVLDSCVLPMDENALLEYSRVLSSLEEYQKNKVYQK